MEPRSLTDISNLQDKLLDEINTNLVIISNLSKENGPRDQSPQDSSYEIRRIVVKIQELLK